MPGGPRDALVDEVNGDSICDQIPLPHGHGSVNFRFSMIPSSLKFQVSSAPSHAGSFRKKLFPPGRVLPIHGSLKRKRGVGERHKSSRVGACCTSGLLVHAPRCTPTPRSRFRLPVRCQGPKNWPTTGLSLGIIYVFTQEQNSAVLGFSRLHCLHVIPFLLGWASHNRPRDVFCRVGDRIWHGILDRATAWGVLVVFVHCFQWGL